MPRSELPANPRRVLSIGPDVLYGSVSWQNYNTGTRQGDRRQKFSSKKKKVFRFYVSESRRMPRKSSGTCESVFTDDLQTEYENRSSLGCRPEMSSKPKKKLSSDIHDFQQNFGTWIVSKAKLGVRPKTASKEKRKVNLQKQLTRNDNLFTDYSGVHNRRDICSVLNRGTQTEDLISDHQDSELGDTDRVGCRIKVSWKRKLTMYAILKFQRLKSVKPLFHPSKRIVLDGNRVTVRLRRHNRSLSIRCLPRTATRRHILKAVGWKCCTKRVTVFRSESVKTEQCRLQQMKSHIPQQIQKLCPGIVTTFTISPPCPRDRTYTGFIRCLHAKDCGEVFEKLCQAIKGNEDFIKFSECNDEFESEKRNIYFKKVAKIFSINVNEDFSSKASTSVDTREKVPKTTLKSKGNINRKNTDRSHNIYLTAGDLPNKFVTGRVSKRSEKTLDVAHAGDTSATHPVRSHKVSKSAKRKFFDDIHRLSHCSNRRPRQGKTKSTDQGSHASDRSFTHDLSHKPLTKTKAEVSDQAAYISDTSSTNPRISHKQSTTATSKASYQGDRVIDESLLCADLLVKHSGKTKTKFSNQEPQASNTSFTEASLPRRPFKKPKTKSHTGAYPWHTVSAKTEEKSSVQQVESMSRSTTNVISYKRSTKIKLLDREAEMWQKVSTKSNTKSSDQEVHVSNRSSPGTITFHDKRSTKAKTTLLGQGAHTRDVTLTDTNLSQKQRDQLSHKYITETDPWHRVSAKTRTKSTDQGAHIGGRCITVTDLSHKPSTKAKRKLSSQEAHNSNIRLTDTNLSEKCSRKSKTKPSDQRKHLSGGSVTETDPSLKLPTTTRTNHSDQEVEALDRPLPHTDRPNRLSTATNTKLSDDRAHVSDRSLINTDRSKKRSTATQTYVFNSAQTDGTSGNEPENDMSNGQPESVCGADDEGPNTPYIYTLRFTWTRRQLTGLGYINFYDPKQTSHLFHRHSRLSIAGFKVPLSLNKRDASSVRMTGLPSTATEDEIHDVVVGILRKKGCIRDVALIREAEFETTESDVAIAQKELWTSVHSLCPKIEVGVKVRQPFPKDFHYFGSVRIFDLTEGVAAFNTLRDSLRIGGQVVTVTQHVSAQIFVDKDLKPSLLPELHKLRREIRKSPGMKNVEVTNYESKYGHMYLTIASDSIDTVSKVWAMYHSLVEEWAPNEPACI